MAKGTGWNVIKRAEVDLDFLEKGTEHPSSRAELLGRSHRLHLAGLIAHAPVHAPRPRAAPPGFHPGGSSYRKQELYRCAYGFLLSYTALIYPSNVARANRRYRFGELRLGRLNKIARVWEPDGRKKAGSRGLMRAYKFEFATYGQQLEAFLTPILAAMA
ncbi:hypothetical protein NOR_01158 [Metarhizium rileyi]|uniref:Uncharacterized protein n=1 Tax=Metarhizium rileyi (strain RCEF 4871) TaxID=1649241 RepID=A0A167IMS2_METRR|nr:hypothetical protein NOR_01158 [Metarhizium rileyi RCEF 4871]